MKDAIDKIIHDGVEEDVAVCGLLVEGNNIFNNYGYFNGFDLDMLNFCKHNFCKHRLPMYLFVMDLRYHAVYRMIQLGVFYLPRDRYNFRVLPDAFEILHQAQVSIINILSTMSNSIPEIFTIHNFYY